MAPKGQLPWARTLPPLESNHLFVVETPSKIYLGCHNFDKVEIDFGNSFCGW